MKKFKTLAALFMLLTVFFAIAVPVMAESETAAVTTEAAATATAENPIGMKAVGSGIAIGIAAGFGALGMGIAVGKSNEGIARQPEAAGTIRGSMILGIVFIETAIIYALVVTILIIFVL